MDKAPDHCNKVCADIARDGAMSKDSYDIVFNQMLAEHVRDGQRFHRNNFKLLKPGGYEIDGYIAIAFFRHNNSYYKKYQYS